MNDDALNDLFARARACPLEPSSEEFAFETRLLAKLRAEQLAGVRDRLVWRLCPWFAAPAAALAIWTFRNPPEIYPVSLTGQNDIIQFTEYFTGTSL